MNTHLYFLFLIFIQRIIYQQYIIIQHPVPLGKPGTDIALLAQLFVYIYLFNLQTLIRLYYNNIQSIRPDSLELVSIVVKSCDMVKLMLKEFASFRHSKSLRDHIIAINTLEEQADQVFVTSMRELQTNCTETVEII